MSQTSWYILLLHAFILGVQLLLIRFMPRLRRAALGVYFILIPVGFTLFTDPEPWVVVPLVCAGLAWVLYWANRAT